MENQTPTYGNDVEAQMSQGQELPQQTRLPMRWRRPVRRVAQDVIPSWLTKRAIVTYILALGIVTLMYKNYCLPWYYMLSGVVSVLVFFIYGSNAAKRLAVERTGKKRFEKRVFLMAFIPRLIWTILIYHLFMEYYGDAFGFDNADALGYDEMARELADGLREGRFKEAWNDQLKYYDVSDMGYATYLSVIYFVTGNSIIVSRLVKCVWSSLTVILLYRLAKRNFNEQTARIAAIFCALWPNFWYYCGVHLKEVEMVFLAVLFVEQADQMLRSRQFTAWKVIPLLLIVGILFTFRTVLALVLILALFFTIVMSSSRVVNWGKRILIGFLAVLFIGVMAGNQIKERAHDLIEQVQGGYQEGNMEWRANRKDASGNKQRFAKYAGATVFAPLIFTIPFPTMVRPFDGQNVQQLLNGGNFIKNIVSIFTIFALVVLLMLGKWRDHMLPLSFLIGYLVVLVFSSFAQAERFHQPAMPFEIMFVACGISIVMTNKRYQRWFTYWCVLMFVAAIAWNWFKLAGRGLI